MKGTEKQVAWAKDIKEKWIVLTEAMRDSPSEKYQMWRTSHESGAAPEFDADAIIAMINAMDDAAEIIDNRNTRIADMYAKHVGFDDYPEWVPDGPDPFDGGTWVYKNQSKK